MYSRIAGTGALPAVADRHQRGARVAHRHQRRVGSLAHRDLRAQGGSAGPEDKRSCVRCGAARARGGGHRARGRRSHRRRDDDAGHGVSRPPRAYSRPSSARRAARPSTCRPCAAASSTRWPSPTAWSRRGRCATRSSWAPRSIRASSTGTIAGPCVLFGDGAGAVVLVPSATPGILSSHLHADGHYKRHPVRARRRRQWRGLRAAVPADGWQRGVQVRGARCSPRSRTKRSTPIICPRARSTG